MKKSIPLILLGISFFILAKAQLRYGDPGVIVDKSKFDSDYPQMGRWANAGVRGGIPFINDFDKTASTNPGNSTSLNNAISRLANSLLSGEKGLLILKNGTYTIQQRVNMKSNVSLKGESREGVICSITMTSSDAFSFNNVHNCGIYSLTIKGSWPEPKYPWNYSLDANREFSNSNISVKLKSGTSDCWLDKVTILNSAHDPMRCPADHNTFRDLIVDGCKRKAGGAEGYFFIQGGDNLITGCQITHLRHISLQGDNVQYNVVYDNDFRQEISFHSGDNGNNLIANNRIVLPADMPPIEAGEKGPYPETENGKPTYFAIMGPWSTKHQVSKHPNFIFRNKCEQHNHNYGPLTPWSDDRKVYFGPQHLGLSNQQRINNFPAYSAGLPDGGVLYAVFLGDSVRASGILISDSAVTIKMNETVSLSASVLPDSATNKRVSWTTRNEAIASVKDGLAKGISEGKTSIYAMAEDGAFVDSCVVSVAGLLKIPVSGISINQTSIQLKPGDQTTLTVEINPEDAYDKSVSWTSTDTDVATVSDGKVNAIAIGEATLRATTNDGAKVASCVVKVSPTITYLETFDNMKLNGWGTEKYIGNHNIEWNVDAKGISGDIEGKGIYFHTGKVGLTSGNISGGIQNFSVDCIDKWSAGVQRTIELLVNGKAVGSMLHTGAAPYTFTVQNINVSGDFTLAIKNATSADGNNTLSIDNVSWNSYSGSTPLVDKRLRATRIYPNPFTDKFFIKTVVNDFDLAVLINLSGRIIETKRVSNGLVHFTPSYANAPAGVYLLKLSGKQHKTVMLIRE